MDMIGAARLAENGFLNDRSSVCCNNSSCYKRRWELLARDRRLTQVARVEDTLGYRIGMPILHFIRRA
jgi:hypothetical protein